MYIKLIPMAVTTPGDNIQYQWVLNVFLAHLKLYGGSNSIIPMVPLFSSVLDCISLIQSLAVDETEVCASVRRFFRSRKSNAVFALLRETAVVFLGAYS